MYEKILIPLDGSRVGEAALSVIEELISKFSPELKVEVILLRVITSLTHWVVAGEASAPVSYTERELDFIQQSDLDYLEKTGAALRNKGVTVVTRVSTGNAAEEILKAADEIGADMIAMSTHGRSGFSRLAFGSVTSKILRAASIPVLTVRAPSDTVN